jgi:hypothetical protein
VKLGGGLFAGATSPMVEQLDRGRRIDRHGFGKSKSRASDGLTHAETIFLFLLDYAWFVPAATVDSRCPIVQIHAQYLRQARWIMSPRGPGNPVRLTPWPAGLDASR